MAATQQHHHHRRRRQPVAAIDSPGNSISERKRGSREAAAEHSVGAMRDCIVISEPPNHPRAPATMRPAIYIMALINILAIFVTVPTEAVDCFKCLSRNGSNKECEDPFNNLNTTRITSPFLPETPPNVMYHAPCYAGRKNRDGLFPASACIKIIGTFEGSHETLVVRHCALDSGTLTQDTELARMSHCGRFIFEGETLKGCVLACPEDACNSAPSPRAIASGWRLSVLAAPAALAVYLSWRDHTRLLIRGHTGVA